MARNTRASGLLLVAALAVVWLALDVPSQSFVGTSPKASALTTAAALTSSSLPHARVAYAPADARLATRRQARGGGVEASFDLTGKVALVTGASRGIGAAIAQKLAAAGATVVGTATSDSGAEAITAYFTDGLKGEGMKLDVTTQADVDALLKAIGAKHGGVDILVNNAGITVDRLMMRMKESEWDTVINTNLNSVYRMSKACIRGMMKARSGRIISISSVVGSMGNVGQANYAAAKAGMEGFTRALAREVGSRGITVNAVAPGFIRTDMTDGLPDEWKGKLLEQVPMGRLGTPEEIADSVLFLAAPSASYITGVTLHVNGGMYNTR